MKSRLRMQKYLGASVPRCVVSQLALHGDGFHLESFASFLKFELVTNCCARYVGSSTTVVTTNQSPASGCVKRVKYSVSVVFWLYGTPLRRSHPGSMFVVVTFSAPHRGGAAPPPRSRNASKA